MDLNSCTFTGRLGHDPEMRYTANGMAVTNFPLAVQVAKDVTLWIKVTAWGQRAETCNQYLSKGDPVGVVGSLSQDEFERRDGTKATVLSLNMTAFTFLGKGSGGQATGSQVKPTTQAAPPQKPKRVVKKVVEVEEEVDDDTPDRDDGEFDYPF